jgi:hypothetical protein
LSRSARLLGVCLVIAMLASGCVRNKLAEPGVRAISTDLQYKELQQKSAAPPNTVPVAQPTLNQPTLPPFGNGIAPPPLTPQACPTAAPTEQADEDVTLKVSRLPDTGEYRWKVSGSEKFEDTRLALPNSTLRQIRNAKGQATGDGTESTFETVEKELSASNPARPTVRSFFRVTDQTATDNTVRQAPPGTGQTVSSGRTSTAGVSLVRIERSAPGGAMTTFVPSRPVRYLITPGTTSTAWPHSSAGLSSTSTSSRRARATRMASAVKAILCSCSPRTSVRKRPIDALEHPSGR